jgi:endonuclease YncB( thermonuclease family)
LRRIPFPAGGRQAGTMRSARFLLIGLVSVTILAVVWRRGEAVGPLITGHVVVVDGDSLSIGKSPVRLAGIDAPELGQSCTGPGEVEWACGREAKRELARRIGGEPVSCRQIKIDPYDRIVAICTASNGDDLSAEMVRAGYALADGRDRRYLEHEASARIAGKGMWSGSFQTPWEWRARMLERDCC